MRTKKTRNEYTSLQRQDIAREDERINYRAHWATYKFVGQKKYNMIGHSRILYKDGQVNTFKTRISASL